jgi:hypothetical protein
MQKERAQLARALHEPFIILSHATQSLNCAHVSGSIARINNGALQNLCCRHHGTRDYGPQQQNGLRFGETPRVCQTQRRQTHP